MKSTTPQEFCLEIPCDESLARRLAQHIRVTPDGHWLWDGARTPDGYPQVRIDGATIYVHRLVESLKSGGWLPAEHDVHHRDCCPYRHCVRPECLVRMPYRAHRQMTAFGAAHG